MPADQGDLKYSRYSHNMQEIQIGMQIIFLDISRDLQANNDCFPVIEIYFDHSTCSTT